METSPQPTLAIRPPKRAGATLPTEAMTDADLAERAATDPQAFALLYARYLDPVYRYCLRRLGSRAAAEDATSIVFTKALAGLPRYRAESFRAWLFTIAHHVVVDQYREARPSQPLEEAFAVADAGPSPEETALAAEDRSTVRALLALLTDRQREVVELRLAGLTGAEIARALGRSQSDVNVTQFRAMARLRERLGVPLAPKGGRHAD